MSRILIVDDRPEDEARGIALDLKERGVTARALHPSQLDEDDLRRADLILVDFELSPGSWDQSGVPVANRCENGWALASVLRWQMAAVDDRPTPGLVALLTNEIGRALNPFDREGSSAAGIISALNGVEWVFSKKAGGEMRRQIACLATAVPLVRSHMSIAELKTLLALPTGQLYWTDLLEAGMPATELLDWKEGVAVFRWMMQRVLPYPTFLISDLWLACRLGVSASVVHELEASSSELGKAIFESRYTGFLSDFLGPRWWVRRVDRVLWEATEGHSSSLSTVRTIVAEALGRPVEEIAEGGDSPVVALDSSFMEERDLVSSEECRRVRPEWWPAFAQDVWARRSVIEDSVSLQSAVL